MNKKIILGIIIFFAFIVRLFPLDFPAFTSDEARITYRGYTLAREGRDELGRLFPFVFNSLEDYQLPAVSYLTAGGIFLFGKNDFGARIFFVLIGTAIVYLTYKTGVIFFSKRGLGIYAAIIVAFSPALIFFSKIPNEFIISAFLLLVLIPELHSVKINKFKLSFVFLFALLTSKTLWLILIPLIFLTLLSKNILKKDKIYLSVWILFFIAAFVLFSKVPQGVRSFIENNFYILNDTTVKNSIEKLRTQGFFWSLPIDRILFNKTFLLVAGFFHWLSQINLSRLFADFDPNGLYGYLKTGAFGKIVIVPFLTGTYFLIKSKSKLLILLIIVTTLPLVFLYPKPKVELIVPVLPFIALISTVGFKYFNPKLSYILLFFIVIDFTAGLFFLEAALKNSNSQRPLWLKNIILEAHVLSKNNNVAFSDDIASDLIPLIAWNAKVDPKDAYEDIEFPYRYRQTKISNMRVIVSEDSFYNCGLDKPTYIFASLRDLKKIQRDIRTKSEKLYRDFLDKEAVFLMPPTICVR